jgi:deazaflavin-dependent oxidoreductase (nitroreductase family)
MVREPGNAPKSVPTSAGSESRTPEESWERLDLESFCYVTTVGRRTGEAHTIEIWFAIRGSTLYMLSGGGARSDWVRNLQKTHEVTVRIDERTFRGRARVVDTDSDEDRLARDLLFAKYRPSYGGDLSGWRERALPVAVDLKWLEEGEA